MLMWQQPYEIISIIISYMEPNFKDNAKRVLYLVVRRVLDGDYLLLWKNTGKSETAFIFDSINFADISIGAKEW